MMKWILLALCVVLLVVPQSWGARSARSPSVSGTVNLTQNITNEGDVTYSGAILVQRDATAGDVTYTLPAAAVVPGAAYNIVKTDASDNIVVVDGNGTETIAGALTYGLVFQYDRVVVQSDGSNWEIVGDSGSRVNVKWFGATGDGSTDDTAAFNSAIAAVTEVTRDGKGEIFVPRGTYKTSAEISVPKGLTIRGASEFDTIIYFTGVSNAFKTTGHNTVFRDLHITSLDPATVGWMTLPLAGTGSGACGIFIENVNTKIQNCRISYFNDSTVKGVAIRTNGGTPFSSLVSDCYFRYNWGGIELCDTITDWSIEDTTILDCTKFGISLGYDWVVGAQTSFIGSNTRISRCLVQGINEGVNEASAGDGYAIYLSRGAVVNIKDVYVEDYDCGSGDTAYGIYMNGESGGVLLMITIEGCNIVTGSAETSYGIWGDYVWYVRINGCHLPASNGIEMNSTNAVYLTADNNFFTGGPAAPYSGFANGNCYFATDPLHKQFVCQANWSWSDAFRVPSLKLYDTDKSNVATMSWDDDDDANRTLKFKLNSTNRELDFNDPVFGYNLSLGNTMTLKSHGYGTDSTKFYLEGLRIAADVGVIGAVDFVNVLSTDTTLDKVVSAVCGVSGDDVEEGFVYIYCHDDTANLKSVAEFRADPDPRVFLRYDASNTVQLLPTSGGDLSIIPTGGDVTITGDIGASGGFKQPFNFTELDVAASQTDADMQIQGTPDTANPNYSYIMPYAGSVLAVAVNSNTPRTAGTLTVDVTINNTNTGLQAVLNASNVIRHAATQAKDTDAFSANDFLSVHITTDGAWLPVTADVVVTVIVEM